MPTTRALIALALACGLVLVSLPAPTYAGSAQYGRTWRKDGVLRGGCHEYRFQYRVRPGQVQPGNDWSAEFFLDRPGEEATIAANADGMTAYLRRIPLEPESEADVLRRQLSLDQRDLTYEDALRAAAILAATSEAPG